MILTPAVNPLPLLNPELSIPASPVLPRAAIRAVESAYQFAVPRQSLMHRAGQAAAAWIQTLAADYPRAVLLLIGPGNNGGDALVCARLLMQQGTDCVCVGRPITNHAPTDAQAAYADFRAAGGVLHADIPKAQAFSLIVDGLFGIGLNQALTPPYRDWVETANAYSARHRTPLLALDIASGLDSDTGMAAECCTVATHTLTFIALKPGLLTANGPDYSGSIRVNTLQIPPELISSTPLGGSTNSPTDWQAHLPQRSRNSHKGDAGSAGFLGGAASMSGALVLASRAALHAGAGRAYAAFLDSPSVGFDPLQPEIMYRPSDTLRQAPLTALALGPGLGRSAAACDQLVQSLDFAGPLVLDADALHLLPEFRDAMLARAQSSQSTLLTPHPGEAAALLQIPLAQVSADRIQAACHIARNYHAHVVLKGCGSIIATPEGQWWINTTGNPGMSTAGMGDVLTGLVTALLAQGMPAAPALRAAVWIHAAAADHCVEHHQGPLGLTASEIIPAARTLLNTLADYDAH